MMPESPMPPSASAPSISDEPHVTIEMGGTNIVIRSTAELDHAYTTSLVAAVNAATDADVDVVIDPHSVRCDDAFASYQHPRSDMCVEHQRCRPAAAAAVASGVIRIPAESTVWTVDVARGRLCRTDGDIGLRFLGPEAWTRVVAVCITPSRLVALRVGGGTVSERRAHTAGESSGPVAALTALA
jgi:hypothetical protein